MSEDKDKMEGAALWRRARPHLARDWQPVAEDEAPDALHLAAYLDGRLHEDEAARLEARLAVEPALLGELLALREAVAAAAAGPEAAPAPELAPVLAGVVQRAQALRAGAAVAPAASAPRLSLAERLFGFSLRPAVPALAGLALLLACAGAFELGRYQAAQLDTQFADTGEGDLPVDLLMAGLL